MRDQVLIFDKAIDRLLEDGDVKVHKILNNMQCQIIGEVYENAIRWDVIYAVIGQL